jgi:hypothetical protein
MPLRMHEKAAFGKGGLHYSGVTDLSQGNDIGPPNAWGIVRLHTDRLRRFRRTRRSIQITFPKFFIGVQHRKEPGRN